MDTGNDITLPPPELLMQIANDPSQENFESSFATVLHVVEDYLGRNGFSLHTMDNILDFGCGVGRFLYAMRPAIKKSCQLHGCDINEECATWAGKNIDFAQIIQNDLEPPLPYPDATFDLVYACSVFTHLTVDLQFKWAWELHRVLKPGGVALLTTSPAALMMRIFDVPDWTGYFRKQELTIIDEDDMLAVFATDASDDVEGQREVAVVHGLGAASSVFSSFQMVEQIPISLLAAGQSANILRRSGVGDVVSLSSRRGVFKSKLGCSDEIEIRLPQSTGRLHFYCEFDDEHFVGRHLAWRIMNGSNTNITPFPFNASYGRNHLISFEIDFSDASTINLTMISEHVGLFPNDASFTLKYVRIEPQLD